MSEAKILGLNHLTLAVSDLEQSIVFYRDLLGFNLCARWSEGAYLEAGSLWLCLSFDKVTRVAPHSDYTHVAFDIAKEGFDSLSERIRKVSEIWQENSSEGHSLYFLDPDGHKLELHVGSLASRLAHFTSRCEARNDEAI
jgi:catechol 2,3-dioxygenase-like lactoylglutathione lyase family enzyme